MVNAVRNALPIMSAWIGAAQLAAPPNTPASNASNVVACRPVRQVRVPSCVCVCRHLPLLVVVALASFKAPRQQWPTRVTFTAQWDKGLHTNAFRVECVRVNRVGGTAGRSSPDWWTSRSTGCGIRHFPRPPTSRGIPAESKPAKDKSGSGNRLQRNAARLSHERMMTRCHTHSCLVRARPRTRSRCSTPATPPSEVNALDFDGGLITSQSPQV